METPAPQAERGLKAPQERRDKQEGPVALVQPARPAPPVIEASQAARVRKVRFGRVSVFVLVKQTS